MVVKYIDDDCFDFCGNSLPTGYFWCITEMHGIVVTVSQTCEEVGVTMTKINSTFDIKTTRISKTNEKQMKLHVIFEQMQVMIKK